MAVSGELSAGYQVAQVAHVTADWIKANPELSDKWHATSNSIIVVETETSEALSHLLENAKLKGIGVTVFREPDLGDEITAIAFAPGNATRKLLANFPLAGKKIHDQKHRLDRERKLRHLSEQMKNCDQTKGQNVLQHGRSVREHYFAITDHLKGRVDLGDKTNWRLPAWVDEYKKEILVSLPSDYIMDRYLTLHDCGKPAVRTVDEDGRTHFPDHAASSEKVYRETFGDDTNEVVAYLIAHDMDAHMLKADGVPEFARSHTAVAQILAALAEVTSNAAMFGGIESTSFKIKFKQIDQRGKALMKLLFAGKALAA